MDLATLASQIWPFFLVAPHNSRLVSHHAWSVQAPDFEPLQSKNINVPLPGWPWNNVALHIISMSLQHFRGDTACTPHSVPTWRPVVVPGTALHQLRHTWLKTTNLNFLTRGFQQQSWDGKHRNMLPNLAIAKYLAAVIPHWSSKCHDGGRGFHHCSFLLIAQRKEPRVQYAHQAACSHGLQAPHPRSNRF